MDKYKQKISVLFLFFALSGLLADKLIPHSHHHDGSGVIIDFSPDKSQTDPKEDEEAGEEKHSEYFQISYASNSAQLNNNLSFTDIIFPSIISQSIPEIPIVIIEKYFLLAKIMNLNHEIIRYFVYKAPPKIDVHKIQFNRKNTYRRSYYERNKENETTMV